MVANDWIEQDNTLVKRFHFTTYNEVVVFSNKIMQIAIDQDHHPVMHVHYNFVKVSITDFEKGSVSEKCEQFVNAVNRIEALQLDYDI